MLNEIVSIMSSIERGLTAAQGIYTLAGARRPSLATRALVTAGAVSAGLIVGAGLVLFFAPDVRGRIATDPLRTRSAKGAEPAPIAPGTDSPGATPHDTGRTHRARPSA